MSNKGVYLGRFQPFHNRHLDMVNYLLQNFPGIELSVGVADWRGQPSKENFLNGFEAQRAARLSVEAAKLINVQIIRFPLFPEVSLEKTLRKRLHEEEIGVVFSGSEKTISALENVVSDGFDLEIVDLKDTWDGVRSTQIREWIRDGDETWRQYVSPSVAEYLSQPVFRERLLSLVGGEKRPWGIEGKSFSSNGVERK